MRVLYFDCSYGMSGDMALGALVDAGADQDQLRDRLALLPVEPFELKLTSVERGGVHATRAEVRAAATGVIRTYANIRSLLDEAKLPADALALAQRIFRRLAEAEGRVHRRDVEQVSFQEAGSIDSIVQVVGSAAALSMLGVERVFSSAVPTGIGLVRTEHGAMPIPSPVVIDLLRGAPMYSRGVPVELVTKTGAAILAATVEGYGELPPIRLESAGYGAGAIRTDFPSLLRVLLGDEDPSARSDRRRPDAGGELMLETNVDDLNPELYGYVLERLFEAGVQDAWLTPIVTRNGRAAVKISVLCSPQRQDAARRVLFRETGSLAIRSATVDTHALEHRWIEVAARHGGVRVRVGMLDGRPITVTPDVDDCSRVAREAGMPAREVYEEATALAREALREDGP
jgi:uncharacterized protein (TIGR00299 family) protein